VWLHLRLEVSFLGQSAPDDTSLPRKAALPPFLPTPKPSRSQVFLLRISLPVWPRWKRIFAPFGSLGMLPSEQGDNGTPS
jgi:hypothetical protein